MASSCHVLREKCINLSYLDNRYYVVRQESLEISTLPPLSHVANLAVSSCVRLLQHLPHQIFF